MTSNDSSTKATMLDVAKLAGVSKKTVSRVLNNEPNVRAETIARVKAAMTELDYRPSLSARSLATNRSFQIALLYDNPVAHYIVRVQTGVLQYCQSQGYSLVIQPCQHEQESITDVIDELIRQSNVDGFVLTPPLSDMQIVTDHLEAIQKRYVRIAPAQTTDGSDCAYCDDEQSAFEMTEHLIGLGHRNIGFVLGHPDHGASQLRFEGFKKALVKHAVPLNEKYLVQGYFDFESGKLAAEKLLSLDHPPTAIFAANDEMASGILAVAHQRQMSLPNDLSVAGYDDDPLASQIWPNLTTVKQPVIEMARAATKLLLDRLQLKEPPHQEEGLSCELVIRESTARLVS